MNERIRELAEQILPNEKEFHQGDPTEWGYFFTGEELEKFAELIVRECSAICIEVSNMNRIGDTVYEGDVCSAKIKENFGVE